MSVARRAYADEVREEPLAPMREMDPKKHFARELWRRAGEKGWSQSELSRHAKMGRDAINKYWNAKILPSDNSLRKISNALGCKPEDLLPTAFNPADKRPAPIEMRVSPTDPNRAFLRVEVELSFTAAAKIIEIVNLDRQ